MATEGGNIVLIVDVGGNTLTAKMIYSTLQLCDWLKSLI